MKKRIKLKDTAPVIHTVDIWGNTVDVPTNGKWTYLSFHRFASCPFCNMRTNELIRNYDGFKARNIEIVSIWPSGKESLLKHIEGQKSAFPIVSDKGKSFYKAYGVTEHSMLGALKLMLHPKLIYKAMKNSSSKIEPDENKDLMPASFLIDPDGKVRMAYYGKHFGDHPDIASIFSVVG